MSIRREIEVTRKALPRPIDVTYGTNILSIEFDLVDFNLPAAVIAEASCKGVSGKSRTQSCSVSENVISFTPKIGFFEEGKNILQLRITTSEGSLFTFAQTVNCHYTIDFDGAQELENDPTFVEMVLQMREDVDELMENNTSGGAVSESGATTAQASTLLAILQKAAFTEALTDEDREALENAWGVSSGDSESGESSGAGDSGNTGTGGDSSDTDGGDDTGNESETEMGETATCYVAMWLSGVPATSVGVEYSDDVEVVDGAVVLKAPVYEGTFYTSGNVNASDKVNNYDSLFGKYVKSYVGDIYYIDPEATYVHNTEATTYTSESISYSPAYLVTVKE